MTREEELKELEYRELRKVIVAAEWDGEDYLKECSCPTCGEKLNEFDEFDYCPYCGQKLDWERAFDY